MILLGHNEWSLWYKVVFCLLVFYLGFFLVCSHENWPIMFIFIKCGIWVLRLLWSQNLLRCFPFYYLICNNLCKVELLFTWFFGKACWWKLLGLECLGAEGRFFLVWTNFLTHYRAIYILFNSFWVSLVNHIFLRMFPLYLKFKIYHCEIVYNVLISFQCLQLSSNISFLFHSYFYLLSSFCIIFIFFFSSNIRLLLCQLSLFHPF